MQPQILVLKEGTDQSQGKPQLVSNINACQLVVDAVRTTLGPRGMDKLIVDHGGKAVISNDGATIMKLLDIVHPAAKTLVDIAKSQDAEVGDGTTSVVILAGELLKRLKPFVEEGVHPRIIVRAVRSAAKLAVDKVKELAVKIESKSPEEQRELLRKCAVTAMSSKLIHQQKDHFSKMVVDAVLSLDAPLLPLDMIGIKKVSGGALEDSFLVAGVAFKKTFSYAGFEMQPKSYTNCKIALLNIELELKAERDNAEVRVNNVEEYQKVVDAEWRILYDKLGALHASGAQVVLSKLPIGDVATQYFADRDMFCAGRVTDEDLRRTQRACGGAVLSSVREIRPESLGSCEAFVERQVGGERYNVFTGCPAAKTCTIILRGGAEQFLEETERSLHDAIMIVRRTIKNDAVVAGGGAIDMELSKHLRDHSKSIAGKEQLLLSAVARAFEAIPRQLCDNAGFDATNLLNKLRQKHHQGEPWYGVDIQKEDIADNFEACVWEPAVVKINAITAACEAAAQVGDGTTSVVILAGELLKRLKPFVEEGVHPRIIVRAVRSAAKLAVDKVKELAVKIESKSPEEQRELLRKCAVTAMSSKLIHQQKDHFSKMVVDAVLSLDAPLLPLDMIGIKKVSGGALEDSFLVAGVAFKKTFSYAGFEMQPKSYTNCKIALLNIELELKAERDNAEVRVNNVEEYQKVVDAEWRILYDKLGALHASGAQVVLSKLPIGDVATQYFADRDMFCAGRVTDEDLRRTQRACGGAVLSSVREIRPESLGSCEAFVERQVGGERYNVFTGCPAAKTCTIILRGGAEQFLEETERSLHDAIMIVRRTIKNDAVVAGGGAIDMELSKHLRDHSKSIAGKEQLLLSAVARAFEAIPRQLCDNAGFDATNLLNKLRQKHHQGEPWYGVDIQKEDIADNFEACVWEPAVVKINAITAACEAAAQILSIDETIKNAKSGEPQMPGRGMGRPRMG